uniref:Zinc knuckle CX2CX4HX4C n=1 Tax=Tanacetum cinerariifolium TaxID=118510 RepID=A0A6L2LJ38_TANCI|nr:zinc knuckle CX2CX4HX4C [Tanacetum cinerariifolium]
MRKEVSDNITTRWNVLVVENESKGSLSAHNIMSSEMVPNDPIVQTVDIHEKPNSYRSAAGGSKPEPMSTRFANTLYGYFIGKRIAFPVVEYYV